MNSVGVLELFKEVDHFPSSFPHSAVACIRKKIVFGRNTMPCSILEKEFSTLFTTLRITITLYSLFGRLYCCAQVQSRENTRYLPTSYCNTIPSTILLL